MTKLIARFGVVILILAIAILIARHEFFSALPYVIIAQVAALTLAVGAWVSLDKSFAVGATPRGDALVTRGPYRFVRHPMYTSALLVIWAAVAGHPSVVSLTVGAVMTAFLATRVFIEEKLLRERFPDYAEYSRRTKALVPFVV